jgi:hypothetical protein
MLTCLKIIGQFQNPAPGQAPVEVAEAINAFKELAEQKQAAAEKQLLNAQQLYSNGSRSEMASAERMRENAGRNLQEADALVGEADYLAAGKSRTPEQLARAQELYNKYEKLSREPFLAGATSSQAHQKNAQRFLGEAREIAKSLRVEAPVELAPAAQKIAAAPAHSQTPPPAEPAKVASPDPVSTARAPAVRTASGLAKFSSAVSESNMAAVNAAKVFGSPSKPVAPGVMKDVYLSAAYTDPNGNMIVQVRYTPLNPSFIKSDTSYFWGNKRKGFHQLKERSNLYDVGDRTAFFEVAYEDLGEGCLLVKERGKTELRVGKRVIPLEIADASAVTRDIQSGAAATHPLPDARIPTSIQEAGEGVKLYVDRSLFGSTTEASSWRIWVGKEGEMTQAKVEAVTVEKGGGWTLTAEGTEISVPANVLVDPSKLSALKVPGLEGEVKLRTPSELYGPRR